MPATFSERLSVLMAQRAERSADVAAIAGAKERTLNDWKNGKTEPTASAVAALAKHWGVTADYLVGLTDFPTGLAPDSFLVDEDALSRALAGEALRSTPDGRVELWGVKVPRRLRIVDYDEFRRLEHEVDEAQRRGRRRARKHHQ